ncbi:MAG: hypothetical protein WC776_05525 [Patescibacteria group bacterium]|jgi:apolipoprotein N-acyltransferase
MEVKVKLTNALRKVALFTGFTLLLVSIFWSQDGFNFSIAGDSGYGILAVLVAWLLAFSVSVVEFVFSTSYRELNPSLIVFGIIAYAYSVYTNYEGILHFQGSQQNGVAALILGLVIDGIPEPLIAWGMRESLVGDFIGNIIKSIFGDDQQKPKYPERHTIMSDNTLEQLKSHRQTSQGTLADILNAKNKRR